MKYLLGKLGVRGSRKKPLTPKFQYDQESRRGVVSMLLSSLMIATPITVSVMAFTFRLRFHCKAKCAAGERGGVLWKSGKLS